MQTCDNLMTDRYQADAPARRVASFISPQGFGHATRAASVMEALAGIKMSLQFDIFTTVPEWFFANSNSFSFQYHRLETDIGLVQKSSFHENFTWDWIHRLQDLLALPRIDRDTPNGADLIAGFISSLLKN